MKNSNVGRSLYTRLVVFTCLVSLMGVHQILGFALSNAGVASAEILVSGPSDNGEKPFVMVNGDRAFTGRTFFSNGTVATTESSSATISLGRLGRIELAPSTSLTLSFSEGRISGTLSKGQINVSNVDGVAVTIATPNDSVKNEGSSASHFAVNVTDQRTGVSVKKGTVSYDNGARKASDDDDDDDDDHWKTWAWIAVIGGAATAIILIVVLGDDDDDNVSPVR
jgi:hypothetical protein